MDFPPIDKDFNVPNVCTYPDCKCPFDHPSEEWCAKWKRGMKPGEFVEIPKGKTIHDFRPQPAPKPTTAPAVWSLVMRDMADRDVLGADRYGVRLQPGNGRDALKDAYEEALDLCAYLRQAIYERDTK